MSQFNNPGVLGAIPGAIIGGLQARSQAKAQYEMQQAQWKKETLNGWLSIDQANFAAAQNMAVQEFNNQRGTNRAIKSTARAEVRLKHDMDKTFDDLSVAFSSNKAATRARQLTRSGGGGGSAEAVVRQLQKNAEKSVRELALQEGLISEQIAEARDSAFEQFSATNRIDAQFFVPGTQPTNNATSAMISGAFSGAMQGLQMGSSIISGLERISTQGDTP